MGKTVLHQNTRARILEAARQVFMEKGYSGSRMQEIADAAGINKGLLHYYFTTKDNLFRGVFEEAFKAFIPRIREVIESEEGIREKVSHLIRSYISMLMSNPHLPAFIVNELNHNQVAFLEMLQSWEEKPDMRIFFFQILRAADTGEIAPVHPAHLLLNIISMCVFPFLSRPIFLYMAKMDERSFDQLLQQRADEIEQIILKQLEP